MATEHTGSVETADLHAWEAVLERLERDVAGFEELARTGGEAHPVEPWVPPVLTGPLPDVLLGRARELLDRQLRARTVLAGRMLETRAQQQPRPLLRTPAAPAAPAYVDVSA